MVHMSTHYWCHGPKCHESKTQDRIRGSKGSKVLRTRKVKQNQWNQNSFFKYFCSNSCYNEFANANIERIRLVAPRNEPLETLIEDPKKVTHQNNYNPSYSWTETEIKERVDTSME